MEIDEVSSLLILINYRNRNAQTILHYVASIAISIKKLFLDGEKGIGKEERFLGID